MNPSDEAYSTEDIWFAAVLMTMNSHWLLDSAVDNYSMKTVFYFENPQEKKNNYSFFEDLANKFWNKEMSIEPQLLVTNYRLLRSRTSQNRHRNR